MIGGEKCVSLATPSMRGGPPVPGEHLGQGEGAQLPRAAMPSRAEDNIIV